MIIFSYREGNNFEYSRKNFLVALIENFEYIREYGSGQFIKNRQNHSRRN